MCFLFFYKFTFSQKVEMHWPHFADKTYDFIIFQGGASVTVQKGKIPKDGKFTLIVPKDYAPYTGMCRWLITDSKEGGGLDMSIPGHDFSISCKEAIPNRENIIFKGYDAVNELNRLSNLQSQIIEKHSLMVKALSMYSREHNLYKGFEQERIGLEKAYEDFHKNLKSNPNHGARFLPIANMANGIALKLFANEEEKYKEIARFFAYDLDINSFYTSGHWDGIISSWAQLHLHVIKDDKILYNQFEALSNRIENKKLYTELTGKLTYYMKSYGMDKQIDVIAPIVVNSRKVTEYLGSMEVYIKAFSGAQGADLIITEHAGKYEDHNHKTSILKSSEFASGSYTQTLLVFYQSGCGPCEELLQQLPQKYQELKERGIRIITISSDESEQVFNVLSSQHPWPDKYCDFQGKEGVNFKNYAVTGTPTLILLDKQGKIVKTMATLSEMFQ